MTTKSGLIHCIQQHTILSQEEDLYQYLIGTEAIQNVFENYNPIYHNTKHDYIKFCRNQCIHTLYLLAIVPSVLPCHYHKLISLFFFSLNCTSPFATTSAPFTFKICVITFPCFSLFFPTRRHTIFKIVDATTLLNYYDVAKYCQVQ